MKATMATAGRRLAAAAMAIGALLAAWGGGGAAVGLLLGSAAAGEGAPAAGQVILGDGSFMRVMGTHKTPLMRTDKELTEAIKTGQNNYVADGPLPPGDWMKPEFDDSGWGRFVNVATDAWKQGLHGYREGPQQALLCLRGKFSIEDPARVKDLKLSLGYRGGAVVYLNGREIARGHLPKAEKPDFLAPAEDYPSDAFLRPKGDPLNYEAGDTKTFADRMNLRLRSLEVALPGELLRKGTNVLAVEIHRAPFFGKGLEIHDMNNVTAWATCGITGIALRAAEGVTPNVGRPKGVQVWTAPATTKITAQSYGDPFGAVQPMGIVGCRNGAFSAQVIVSSDGPIAGLKATAGELSLKGGQGSLPASAVQVLYALPRSSDFRLQPPIAAKLTADCWFDALTEQAPATVAAAKEGGRPDAGAVQPVWVKVRVPATAAPGDYEGQLTVNVEGAKPVEVPVRLKVLDWTLPGPLDFTAHVGLIQSPDSVAIYYNVPLWSEKHWALMEKSFAVMREVGSKNVYLPLIARTNFGNEQSMVRWVRNKVSGVSVSASAKATADTQVSGNQPDPRNLPARRSPDGEGGTLDTYTYDFTVFDRYLDLALKYLKPDVISIYVWDPRKYVGRLDPKVKEKYANPRVSLLDPATGKVEDLVLPAYDSPEAAAVWKPLLLEVQARLKKRGLGEAMMLGMTGDYLPTKQTVQMFAGILPGVKWIQNSHPGNLNGTSIHGVPYGYQTRVYVPLNPPMAPMAPGDPKRPYGWKVRPQCDFFPRHMLRPSADFGWHRTIVETALVSEQTGLGRIGADFWPVPNGGMTEEGRRESQGVQGHRGSVTITARYPEADWDQLNINTSTEALLAAGPEGALTTARFELIREGVQDCEARIFIEKVLDSAAQRGKLGDDLARRSQEVLDKRRAGVWDADKLYAAAAEVAATLK
jgi:hypothetical protein